MVYAEDEGGNMICKRGHARPRIECRACRKVHYQDYTEARRAHISLAVRWFGMGFLFCVCVVYAAERFL